MIRVLVNELLFYPLLICDMIEFIVDKGYEFEAENSLVNLISFLCIHIVLGTPNFCDISPPQEAHPQSRTETCGRRSSNKATT